MKYFLDTEFVEGFRKPLFGRKRHFIDLISIAIVCEDGRELYLISKEFDVDYIWNNPDTFVKNQVLKKIYEELSEKYLEKHLMLDEHYEFTKGSVKALISSYGKSRQEIMESVFRFFKGDVIDNGATAIRIVPNDPKIWGYFADYDWVVFCALWGRMIDLPKGFPFFCRDLKQEMVMNGLDSAWKESAVGKPEHEHHALADAKWNFKLYNAIEKAKEETRFNYAMFFKKVDNILMANKGDLFRESTTNLQRHRALYNILTEVNKVKNYLK